MHQRIAACVAEDCLERRRSVAAAPARFAKRWWLNLAIRTHNVHGANETGFNVGKHMLLDFLTESVPSLDFDLCIIGAGAAGISLAREFVGSRHKVLLLESGGRESEPQTQALYESEVVGLEHFGIHNARVRAFGGTTNLWGGQSLRLGFADFQQRLWVPHSGWPITEGVLDPYYERAEAVLQIGERFTYRDLCRRFGFEHPNLDPHKFEFAVSQWSRWPNFAIAYGRQLESATNVTLMLHANAIAIVTNDNCTRVNEVEVKTLSGKVQRARARYYVLCCGAIETARLLLNSTQRHRLGIGNQYDLVGRYFMDHLHADMGRLEVTDRKRLHNAFESFVVGGYRYSPKLILAADQQARLGLLRILGEVIFEDSPQSVITLIKHAYATARNQTKATPVKARLMVAAMSSATTHPWEVGRMGWRVYARGRGAKPTDCLVRLGVQCENAPYYDSRVSLSDSRDCLGMRRSRLNWVVGEFERRTLRMFVRLFSEQIHTLKCATYNTPITAVLDDNSGWRGLFHDAAHQMGTTRMAESPRDGVVDPECRVHGIDNLYIGSSAVFPTGGHSNPTLTILALCLRIADTIKPRLID
jgi:choline dehydrogenase-like flavoprotein